MKSKREWLAALVVTALALSTAVSSWTAEIKRTPFAREEAAQAENSPYAAKMVRVDNWIFPSGIYGTRPDPLDQVDEVIEKMNARLAEQGLSFSDLRQVTYFVKDGAADPVAVLNRSGQAVARLALKRPRGVGTIIRLPSMPGNSAVMLDIVAGAPLEKGTDTDGYRRVQAAFGPFKDSIDTISGNGILFTAGFEAMDFQHDFKVPATLEEQVTAVVNKLDNAFKNAGLSLANMVQHNIYYNYKLGVDPSAIVRKFHEEMNKREPLHKSHPGVGAMMGVDGMAHPAFMLEVDAVGTTRKPQEVKYVPFTETPEDVCKTATVGALTYVVDVVGVEYANNLKYPDSLDAQIELAVKNLRDMLRKAGLDLENLVKIRLMVKKGAGDAGKVRSKFYQVLTSYAPALKAQPPAETLMFVEKLDRELAFQIVAIAAR
jgi:enamine deaminase RidA (YjgF/YER057c/UK114 family)